jgi:hypothetical protein
MCNIITKLLIVVVPRHTAGDGCGHPNEAVCGFLEPLFISQAEPRKVAQNSASGLAMTDNSHDPNQMTGPR